MSRRFLFAVAAFVVMLYFSVILLMLHPLHSTMGFPYNRVRSMPAIDWCKKLQLRSKPGDVVALASYPGSGNTWLRYLLQQATGILTGSIYMDMGLRLHGFPGENVTNGLVLAVKTHESPPVANNTYKSAILLIRNPRDAILADFNRQLMGHIGTAPKSAFKKKTYKKEKEKSPQKKEKKGKLLVWETFVFEQLRIWEKFYKQWLKDFRGPVHILFYEDLVRSTGRTLKDLLQFLKYDVTSDDLMCALMHREGIYRRKKKLTDFDPFTEEMYLRIHDARKRLTVLVNEYRAQHAKVIQTTPRGVSQESVV